MPVYFYGYCLKLCFVISCIGLVQQILLFHVYVCILIYFPIEDERKAEIDATTRLFDETRELLEQMDLEIQDMPADVKPKYATRLQCYGQELARLGQEFVSISALSKNLRSVECYCDCWFA